MLPNPKQCSDLMFNFTNAKILYVGNLFFILRTIEPSFPAKNFEIE